MDAGFGGQEWSIKGAAYYVLVIGYSAPDETPLAIILMEKPQQIRTEGYVRLGMARLDDWKGLDFKTGAEQRAVVIF